MIVIALGLATAVAYGASDFLGGLASRRAKDPLAVVALLKLSSIGVFALAVVVGGTSPSPAAIAWGGGAGLAAAVAYVAFFRALVAARMGVVTTVTAVWAAIVPVAVGFGMGERPSALAWAGIAGIIFAIVLITYTGSRTGGPVSRHRFAEGVFDATVAGFCFGAYFVCLDRAAAVTGGVNLEWPLLVAAISSTVVAVAVAQARRVGLRPSSGQLRMIVPAGVLSALGAWAFISAVSEGWISIVAAVASLSPALTILLARVLLHELLTPRQVIGVALALMGVVAVSVGLPD